MLTITLPVPPSLNNAYMTRGDGKGRFLRPHGKQYKGLAIILARGAASIAGWRYRDERLTLALRFWFPDKRRRDIDNSAKLAIDAVATALGFDDSVIDRLILIRAGTDRQHPRCEVTVAVCGESEQVELFGGNGDV